MHMDMNESPRPENVSSTPPPEPPNLRTWQIAMHLSPLVILTVIPFANVIAPFVIWLIKKEEMPQLDAHGKAVLNFQITVAIALLLCIPLVLIVIGIVLMVAIYVFDLVMIIMGSMAASEGRLMKYPLSIQFLK